MLVVSEHFIANYGECKININDERDLTVQGGKNLLSMLTAEKIFIPSACGGRGTCGLCKLKVLEGAGNILPTEEPYLSKEERTSNVRLSCQVKVKNDLRILIPRELFAIREYVTRCTKIEDLTHDIKLFRLQLDRAGDDGLCPRAVRAGAHAGLREEPGRSLSSLLDRLGPRGQGDHRSDHPPGAQRDLHDVLLQLPQRRGRAQDQRAVRETSGSRTPRLRSCSSRAARAWRRSSASCTT